MMAVEAHRQEELGLIEPVPESPPPMMNLASHARAYLAKRVEG